MKTYFLIFTAFLAAAPAALAWPFVVRDPKAGYVTAENQYAAVQMDTDRPLELITGGNGLLNYSPTGQAADTTFPEFDFTPYPAGSPQVTFLNGRMAAGDIDGDGDIDVVRSAHLYYNGTQESATGRIMTCRNNGDGTFTRTWQWLDNTGSVEDIARTPSMKLADLDRDGDLDLIETFNRVRIHLNPGNGDFSAEPTLIGPAYTGVTEIEVADFDRNGWPDIAMFAPIAGLDPGPLHQTTGRFILLSNNAGTWTSAILRTNTAGLDYGHTASADMDGDGKTDLIALSEATSAVEIHYYRNLGTSFAAASVVASLQSGSNIATGDLNEDGIPDIVCTGELEELFWLRGTGGGTFAPAATIQAAAAVRNSPRGICVADMDGDGDQDVITGSGRLVYENTAIHREAAARVELWTGTNPTGAVDLTVGDLNNDGKEDLIAADGGGKRVMWFSGNGAGLSAQFPITTGNQAPSGVAAGDFNGDGWMDLTWAASGVLRQALSQDGGGTAYDFSDAAFFTGMTRILPMDFDRDGDLDVLAISPTLNSVRWLSNTNGEGVWPGVAVSSTAGGVTAVAAGQQVPGGRPEVATVHVTTAAYGAAHRYAWNGSAWDDTTVTTLPPTVSSSAVIMADVQDSTAGLETIYSLDSTLQINHGAFNVTAGFGTTKINQLAAADWDGDGYTDILSATATGVNLYLHKRGNQWSPLNPKALYTGTAQQDLVIMDLNGDGRPDAVSVEATTGELRLIYNTSGAIQRNWSTSASTPLIPGQGASPFRQFASNRGGKSATNTFDAAASPADFRFRFLNAVFSGGTWVPGAALTQSQVSALVENLSILDADSTPAIFRAGAAPSSVNVNGYYILTLSASARSSLQFSALSVSVYDLKIRLKSTAGSAGIARFFVEVHPESQSVPLDTANASGAVPLSVTGDNTIQRTLITLKTPGLLDAWRQSNFGTYDADGNAANDADPDRDDVPNLMEYIMNQSPTVAGGIGSGSPIGLTGGGLNTALIADLRLLTTYDGKVRLIIQQSTGLNDWTSLSTRTGTGVWTGAQPTTGALSGGRTRFNFDTGAIPATSPKYFLRLLAEELP